MVSTRANEAQNNVDNTSAPDVHAEDEIAEPPHSHSGNTGHARPVESEELVSIKIQSEELFGMLNAVENRVRETSISTARMDSTLSSPQRDDLLEQHRKATLVRVSLNRLGACLQTEDNSDPVRDARANLGRLIKRADTVLQDINSLMDLRPFVAESNGVRQNDRELKNSAAAMLLDPKSKIRPTFFIKSDPDGRHDPVTFFSQIKGAFDAARNYATATRGDANLSDATKIQFLETCLRDSKIPDLDAILEDRTSDQRNIYKAMQLFVYNVLSGPEVLMARVKVFETWVWKEGQFSSYVAAKNAQRTALCEQAELLNSILPPADLSHVRHVTMHTKMYDTAVRCILDSDRVNIDAGHPIILELTEKSVEREEAHYNSMFSVNIPAGMGGKPQRWKEHLRLFAANEANEEMLLELGRRVDIVHNATTRLQRDSVRMTNAVVPAFVADTVPVARVAVGGGSRAYKEKSDKSPSRCYICDKTGHGFENCSDAMDGSVNDVLKRASAGPTGVVIPIEPPSIVTRKGLIQAIRMGREKFYNKWRRTKRFATARKAMAHAKRVEVDEIGADEVIDFCLISGENSESDVSDEDDSLF